MTVNLSKIKGLMAEHEDTQSKLAEKLGISTATMGNYLTGKSEMRISTVGSIAQIYGVDIAELVHTEK